MKLSPKEKLEKEIDFALKFHKKYKEKRFETLAEYYLRKADKAAKELAWLQEA